MLRDKRAASTEKRVWAIIYIHRARNIHKGGKIEEMKQRIRKMRRVWREH